MHVKVVDSHTTTSCCPGGSDDVDPPPPPPPFLGGICSPHVGDHSARAARSNSSPIWFLGSGRCMHKKCNLSWFFIKWHAAVHNGCIALFDAGKVARCHP